MGEFETAESAARGAEYSPALMPDEWGYFNALSHLGESLLMQDRFSSRAIVAGELPGAGKARADNTHGIQIQSIKRGESASCRHYEAQNTEEANRWRAICEKAEQYRNVRERAEL